MVNFKPLRQSINFFLILCALNTLVYFLALGGHTDMLIAIKFYAAIQLMLLLTILFSMKYAATQSKAAFWFNISFALLFFIQIVPAFSFIWFRGVAYGYPTDLIFAGFHIVIFVWGLLNLISLRMVRSK